MAESEPALRPSETARKPNKAALRKAGRKALDMASLLTDLAPPGARLIIDLPVDGKGQVRLSLSGPEGRVSVWGKDMADAMRQLVAKATG